MKYKIVSDSSSNLFQLEQKDTQIPYATVPLHILVGNQSFTDDLNLNLSEMYASLSSYKGKTSTACPSPDDWIRAFEDAETVFCVTITSGLSGSCSSAHTAKQMYEEKYSGRKVFIIDSLSTGPEMVLLIEKIRDLMAQDMDGDQIYNEVIAYHKHTHLFYSLASLDNLARNGRVNPLLAKGLGVLGIRVIGTTTEEGTLKPCNKGRGDSKAMQKLVDYMKSTGYKGGRVIISHSDNPTAAELLKDMIIKEFGSFPGFVHPNTGLCGYYAEQNSVLVGFETI